MQKKRKIKTSWNHVAGWYKRKVGEKGSFFHTNLILPELLELMHVTAQDSILDLACGQGVMARNVVSVQNYTGIDIAPSLITYAKENTNNKNCHFFVADVSKSFESLGISKSSFSHVTVVLALQNIEHMSGVFKNAYEYLKPGGRLFIVINHPMFRIPKFSDWDINYSTELQSRRVYKYMSLLKVPIDMHPGNKNETFVTTSFHYPLSYYIDKLYQQHFLVEQVKEWCSPKQSKGKYAVMENRARDEFPLFMCIVAVKQ